MKIPVPDTMEMERDGIRYTLPTAVWNDWCALQDKLGKAEEDVTCWEKAAAELQEERDTALQLIQRLQAENSKLQVKIIKQRKLLDVLINDA